METLGSVLSITSADISEILQNEPYWKVRTVVRILAILEGEEPFDSISCFIS
jgi:hypothetical protein